MIVMPQIGMFGRPVGAAVPTIPTTAAGWFTGRTADDFWLMDEAAGNLVSEVNTVTLTQSGAVPTYQQVSPEFPSPPTTNRGILFGDNATTQFAAAGSVLYDIAAATSIAFAMVIDPGTTAAGTRRFFRKFSTQGYVCEIQGDDDPRFSVFGASATVTGRIIGSYEDGNPYLIVWSVDRAAQQLRGFTNRSETATDNIAGTGSPANAGSFVIGGGGLGGCVNHILLGFAVFTGANAEGFSLAEITGAWAAWGP